MSFEIIDNLAPEKAASVPVNGVAIAARKLGTRSGKLAQYIKVSIGKGLAKKAALTHETQQVMLMLGGGPDAGKLAIGVSSAGKFVAKRAKNGTYALTVNAASAEGLFALDFPSFTVDTCEVIRPENGKAVQFTFKASDAMLDAD